MTPLPALCARCFAVVHLVLHDRAHLMLVGDRAPAFGWLDPETGEPHRCSL